MIEIASMARGRHAMVPVRDKTGRTWIALILKYTFTVDPFGRVALAEDGAAPRFADEFHGEDGLASSIKKPSDLCEHKPGTDVLLIGHAHAPIRQNVSHVDVGLRMGPVAKRVRAHGVRAWQAAGLAGIVPGPARPVREPIPLRYELAWGGLDLEDPEAPVGEPRNTVGRGVARDPRKLVGQPAAQLEDPASPIRGGDNVPACFGAIHRHWQPRARFAGTYDDAWMANKMPLLPDDFDVRYHVTAPPDQWSAIPLRGDEPIEVTGATPEGTWRFALPRIAPGFSRRALGERTDFRTHLDTVLIDADAMRVELTFRAAIPAPRKLEMLGRLDIIEKEVA